MKQRRLFLSLCLGSKTTSHRLLIRGFRTIWTTARFWGFLFWVWCFGPAHVFGETYTYDDAGKLHRVDQNNGLSITYGVDAEGNVTSSSHISSDTADAGGSGNGIPDWWEYLYFGTRGINPLASNLGSSSSYSNLICYAQGINPLTQTTRLSSFMCGPGNFQDYKIYPYFSFVVAKDAVGMIHLEQSSDGGITWQSGASLFELNPVSDLGMGWQTLTPVDLGDGTERIFARSLTCFPNYGQLIFRLEVDSSSAGLATYGFAVNANGQYEKNPPPPPSAPNSNDVPAFPNWALVVLAAAFLAVARRVLPLEKANRYPTS